MYKSGTISIVKIVPDPMQPRKLFETGELVALSDNLKKIGQRVPVILFQDEGKFVLLDGERRWRAAKLAGLTDMAAMVFSERPPLSEIQLVRFSLDFHKAPHTAMERSNLLAEIMRETGCNVTELAAKLAMSQGMASKLLTFQNLPAELQTLLAKSPMDIQKVTLISQVKDPVKQIELVKSWGHLGRDEFRAKVNDNGDPKPKSKRATFMLPSGMNVVVNGSESTLEQVIQGLTEVLKELRRGLSQGLDIVTVGRVLADKAKGKS